MEAKYSRKQAIDALLCLREGESYAIAELRSGIPVKNIPFWIRRYGFAIPPLHQRKKGYLTDKQIRWAYAQLEAGAKYRPIAKLLGTTRGGLWASFQRLELPTPKKGVRRCAVEKKLQDAEEIRKIYERLASGEKRFKVCKELDINPKTLRKYLSMAGYKTIKKKPLDIWLSATPKEDVIAAHQRMIKDKTLYKQECKALGMSRANLRQLFVRLKLPLPQIFKPIMRWISRFSEEQILQAKFNIENGSMIGTEARKVSTSRQNLKSLIRRYENLLRLRESSKKVAPSGVEPDYEVSEATE